MLEMLKTIYLRINFARILFLGSLIRSTLMSIMIKSQGVRSRHATVLSHELKGRVNAHPLISLLTGLKIIFKVIFLFLLV